jgi:hypothetical protein
VEKQSDDGVFLKAAQALGDPAQRDGPEALALEQSVRVGVT